jgi:hypothetical protein
MLETTAAYMLFGVCIGAFIGYLFGLGVGEWFGKTRQEIKEEQQ